MSTKTADGRTVTTRPHEPLSPGQCAAITQSVLRCSRSAQWDDFCFQHWAIEERRAERAERPGGYRPHEPDLIEDPHYWGALLGNPFEVLCHICGKIQTQNDDGPDVWSTVREGR